MVSLKAILTVFAVASGIKAAPSIHLDRSSNEVQVQTEGNQATPNSEGFHNGYFYKWWTDGESPATYSNGANGSYSVTWQSPGNFFGGKGWKTGSGRKISFSADWKPVKNGNSVSNSRYASAVACIDARQYLGIYGWARNPQSEYYIIEAHGSFNPGTAARAKGSVIVDGATYKLYHNTRVGPPSTLQQYYAIREDHRTSGTIDTGKMFEAFAAAGMKLGDHDWQIVATEAYYSAGKSYVTISTPP
ncbi:endo-1,4-beta-xylanase I [Paramyrothecium foliicola]|nr:endo-1,4-beta-xylanase I [Paramyrothecium foliicola]